MHKDILDNSAKKLSKMCNKIKALEVYLKKKSPGVPTFRLGGSPHP